MSSSEAPAAVEEVVKESTPPKPAAVAPPTGGRYWSWGLNCSVIDVALRVLLFAATLVSLVVMVTSDQSKLVPLPQDPTQLVKAPAKFKYSSAFIYLVAAMSVACLYSIITTLVSISVILKPAYRLTFLLHFAFWDVLMLGVAASATGAAGGVAYLGLKGNDHVKWAKVCSTYDKFCQFVGASIFMALFAAILLVLLSMLSIYSLYKRVPK